MRGFGVGRYTLHLFSTGAVAMIVDSQSPLLRLFAVVLTGIISGFGGLLVALVLHAIQHIAFGYSLDKVIGPESFLVGVTDASAARRFAVIVFAGLVAGCGWWALDRFAKARMSIEESVADPNKPMPVAATLLHILLQVATVAMGSPLGREVAPREFSALGAGMLARRLRLTYDDTRLLIACGAGAGLAAVYNVPLAGALFTLEVLLVTFRWQSVIAALMTSAIATWVATSVMGNASQYHFVSAPVTSTLMMWSLLVSPFLGAAAFMFRRWTHAARCHASTGWRMPIISLAAFTLLAVFSLWLPQLPGNGKGPFQLALDGTLDLRLVVVLLALKVVVILAVLRAGAAGGLMTPGLAVGALLSTLLFVIWNAVLPGDSEGSGGFAMVGAAAFLGASNQMPLTAVVVIMEFTHMDHHYLMPTLLCVAGAYLTCKALEQRAGQANRLH